MSQVKISVVMCCYNAERYLGKAIDSILNQTFTDFEFIIWNDGSTDKTEEIVKSYGDNRIKYFYHENLGIGGASRLACELVTAKYIARMDSDDIAASNRLQVEYDYLESHSDTVLVSSAINYMDEDDNVIGRTFPYTCDSILRSLVRNYDSPIVNPAVMFRTDAYRQTGGYLPLKYAEDRFVFARLSQYGKFANLKDVLLNYRLSTGSISSASMSEKYQPVFLTLFKTIVTAKDVNKQEVCIYNDLVSLSKQDTINNVKHITDNRYKKNIDEKLHDILCQVLGYKNSVSLICAIKNMVGIIRYKYV